MANTKTNDSKTTEIKDSAQYVVHIATAVDVLGERLYPGREYRLRGDLLKTIQASIQDVTEIR
jgi:hypothetical protein